MPEYVKKMIENKEIKDLIECGFEKLAFKLQETELSNDLANNHHRLAIVQQLRSERK